MIKGIDISNWTGVPSTEQVDCWWESGVRFIVIGLQVSWLARAQQRMLGKFNRMYYVDLPGRDLGIPEPGSLVFVDIEQGCFTSKAEVIIELGRLARLGFLRGIYGNYNSMHGVIQDDDSFGVLPLMYANYNAIKSPQSFDNFDPFNGWTRPLIWQYAGDQVLCDANVDLDEMEDFDLEQLDLMRIALRAILNPKNTFRLAPPDPITQEQVVEVLTGVPSDDKILLRDRPA